MATKNIVPNANGEGSIGTAAKGWGGAFLTSTATSSTSAGAKLQLISNDGAVMADTHQLGIIEFLGAEDGSGTISLGASIEAVADETFTASENASALVFKTTSGTTVSEVLRLDKDKNATFAGTITADAGIDIDNFNIDGTTISLSSGNMIIGTANAASALTISDYGLLTMTVGASSNPRISFAGTNVSGTHFIQLDRGSGASSSSFEVYVNGGTRFEVKANGNVEIADGNLGFAGDGNSIAFGADSEVVLTHVHNNGLLLGSGGSYALYFRDTDLYIHSVSDGTLKLNANTELDLTAPTIDINGAADISGLLTMSGGANPDLNVQGTAIIRGNSSSHETHYFTTAAANVAAYHMKDASGNIKNTFSAGGLNFITGGNFVAGATTDVTGTHYFQKAVSANGGILYVGSDTTGRFSLVVQASDSGYNNTPDTCLKVGGTSSTSRSISAAGTFNGSGADYAEYMTKSVTDVINKGDIVGVDSNGLLTNIFNDAISFVIKSTNPSFIGNDTWGIESEDKDEIEEARNKVDRIAFSGQVPCNITGASVGDYIIPVASSDGKITGEAVSNPTFEQYKISVGKVWKIMENGNSWVAVKIG